MPYISIIDSFELLESKESLDPSIAALSVSGVVLLTLITVIYCYCFRVRKWQAIPTSRYKEFMDRMQQKRLEKAILKAKKESGITTSQAQSQQTIRYIEDDLELGDVEMNELQHEPQDEAFISQSHLEELPFYDVPLPFYYTHDGIIIEHTLPTFTDASIPNNCV